MSEKIATILKKMATSKLQITHSLSKNFWVLIVQTKTSKTVPNQILSSKTMHTLATSPCQVQP